MFIDLTLKLTPKMVETAQGNEKIALVGHLGTHFDVMNQQFPLEYCQRKGLVFDITNVQEREVSLADIDINKVEEGMFVGFCSNFSTEVEYGSQEYFKTHPILAFDLINALIEKKISIIGVDFAGVRRGKEHTPTDKLCADNKVFVVENLVGLKELCFLTKTFDVYTFPMNYVGLSGLPCRVIAKVQE